MSQKPTCPECGSGSLFLSDPQHANGGYGPYLLRGLGALFQPAKLRVLVCAGCGLMRTYAEPTERARLPGAGWRRL